MSTNVNSGLVNEDLVSEVQDVGLNPFGSSQTVRRAWDSNPQVLADNGFQVPKPTYYLLRRRAMTAVLGVKSLAFLRI
jgi:hypothetical protein